MSMIDQMLADNAERWKQIAATIDRQAQDNANAIANAVAHVGDGVSAAPGAPYDLIATNPPFHLGRRQTPLIAQQFIAAAPRALAPGGRFFLVANRFLPYERDMLEAFGNAREVAGDGRYKVLLAIREDLRMEDRG